MTEWGFKRLGYATYDAYLRGPEWRKLKRYHRQLYGPACGVPDCPEPAEHLHHWTYERLGAEHVEDLVGLCVAHHKRVHALLRERGQRRDLEALRRTTIEVCGNWGPWRPDFRCEPETKKERKTRRQRERAARRKLEARQTARVRSGR